MSDNADFRFEILKYLPGTASPTTPPLELPVALLESFGSVNRAAERDLLSFKTGDLTLVFRNADGFFDDLFAFLMPVDRWQLRVFRRGAIQFWGVVMGLGSIVLDRTDKLCEITAYGLTRQLTDSSAAGLARGVVTTLPQGAEFASTLITVGSVGGFNVFDDLHISDGVSDQVTEINQIFFPDKLGVTLLMTADYRPGAKVTRVVGFMTVATATATQTTLTLQDPGDGTNATAGLLTGDILHLTDQVNSEDVTVKQVTSATVISLETALVNSYATGMPVEMTTPFYRYKTVAYLADQLFRAAGITGAEMKLSGSLFSKAAPTPVNLSGLPAFSGSDPAIGNQASTCPAERNGLIYETLAGDGTYRQPSPDGDWVREDVTVQAWVDWSRYYREDETGPTIILRDPYNVESDTDGHNAGAHKNAWDYKPTTKTMYILDRANRRILSRTTTDGTTWSGTTIVVNAGLIAGMSNASNQEKGVEIDAGRGLLYIWSGNTVGGNPILITYDLATTTQTSLRQAGDDNNLNRYGGFVYVPELDCVIGLRSLNANGTSGSIYGTRFNIVAFRGNSLLWERPFPDCLISDYSGGPPGSYYNYPTSSLRYLRGTLYCVVVSDGKAQFVSSGDQFQSYTMRALADPGVGARIFGARIAGTYRISCWSGTAQRGKLIAAPFYAGVVEYFDMTDKSCSDGLKELSEIVNALAWVDDDGQGHFVARDLFDPGAVLEIADRIKSRRDTLIWDQTAQFAEAGGQVAGNKAFAASGISIDSDLIPNDAFAQALADSYVAFYGTRRKQIELNVADPDGHIYRPLDRVTIDGFRYMVYESDHDLVNDEVALTLLEDP